MNDNEQHLILLVVDLVTAYKSRNAVLLKKHMCGKQGYLYRVHIDWDCQIWQIKIQDN